MIQATPILLDHNDRTAALVAVEVLVLWPSEPVDGTDVWPLFVLVVDEEADADGTSWLSAHLDGDRVGKQAVTGHCRWSVVVPGEPLLGLSVRASTPVDLDLDVLVPAECFLGLFDIAAHGATVALTTRGHARRLTARAGTSQVFDDILLLGCRTSAKLAELAHLLCDNGNDGG